ncbi:replication factor C subunit 2 [Diutina rugosa]
MTTYSEEKAQHTPWVEKYRPKNLDAVSSQDHAVDVLKKTIQSGNLPHMLFYGPPGTGKTSTILALAKQLYGPSLYKSRVLELNASDERGISIVRQKIKNFARLAVSNPTKEDLEKYPCPPFKIIILDEADSMTNEAQSALRRTIEKYANVTRFCLICNYVTRIIDPLASRCAKFRFRSLADDNAISRLKFIADEENVPLSGPDVLSELLKISGGDLRKAITYLQSGTKLISMGNNGTLTAQLVREIAGILPPALIDELVASIKSGDAKAVGSGVQALVLQGWSAQQILDQIHDNMIFDDRIDGVAKNKIAATLFEADSRLNNGGDEYIQLLNVALQVSTAF